jgi:hypothetical protein
MVMHATSSLSPSLSSTFSLDKEKGSERASGAPEACALSHAPGLSEPSPASFAGESAGEGSLPSPTQDRGRGHEKVSGKTTTASREAAKKSRGTRAMLAMLGAMAAAGCAVGSAPAPVVRPLMVRVPVLHETPCPMPALADPALPIAGLKPASAPADTMRAYAAAVAILKGAVRERDAVLAGCARAARKAPATATVATARTQAEKTR